MHLPTAMLTSVINYYPEHISLFRTLQGTEHTLTVEENNIPSTISTDRATPAKTSTNHPRRSYASKSPSKDKTTSCETD